MALCFRPLFFTVLVWILLVQVQSQCPGQERRYHSFMSSPEIANKRLNSLVLLGSHDAGTKTISRRTAAADKEVNLLSIADTNAITQKLDIYGQLCASYRVFDLRFKQTAGSTMEDYRIWHGTENVANFYFDSVNEVVRQVNDFCLDAEHAGEVIFLRMKIYPDVKRDKLDAKLQFLTYFLKQIGRCVPILPRDTEDQPLSAYRIFKRYTVGGITALPRLQGDGRTAAVIVMVYDDAMSEPVLKRTVLSQSRSLSLRDAALVYSDVMAGKSSEDDNVQVVLRGQLKKYQEWSRSDSRERTPFFGFWMTLTLKPGNVLKKTFDEIGEEGLYCSWFNSLLRDGKFPEVGGLTIWTDAAGDWRMAAAKVTALEVNRGIAAGSSNIVHQLSSLGDCTRQLPY